jgi:hypothetical protein
MLVNVSVESTANKLSAGPGSSGAGASSKRPTDVSDKIPTRLEKTITVRRCDACFFFTVLPLETNSNASNAHSMWLKLYIA